MDDLVTWLRGVLAEDEAKRAIVDAYQANDPCKTPNYWVGLEVAIRHLAWAYRDRPGYRQEWRP